MSGPPELSEQQHHHCNCSGAADLEHNTNATSSSHLPCSGTDFASGPQYTIITELLLKKGVSVCLMSTHNVNLTTYIVALLCSWLIAMATSTKMCDLTTHWLT
ncbi:TPA: hypothetical protein ACH3X1_012879 [Trebouxia sp. C0004]